MHLHTYFNSHKRIHTPFSIILIHAHTSPYSQTHTHLYTHTHKQTHTNIYVHINTLMVANLRRNSNRIILNTRTMKTVSKLKTAKSKMCNQNVRIDDD